jgi:hypothetical protein
MNQHSDNPPTNRLGPGLNERDISAAVEKSGYPLQTVVADFLRTKFDGVQEEWCYLDKNSADLRAIDVLAAKFLFTFQEHPRIRPTLNLLIECKQSSMPYMFFLTPHKPVLFEFPVIAGLANERIKISTDDDKSTWNYSILHVLGLLQHAFIKTPDYCTTFSKCVRKGSEIELSGSESFYGLVLPVLKSLYHFQEAEKPPHTARYFDAHLAIGIGVVDAPMVGVRAAATSNELTLIPWVRVLRHEYLKDAEKWDRSKLLALDVIHKDFLQLYIENHVLPFAKTFGALALKHQEILATGKGFAKGMGKNSWGDIESRIEPSK